MSTIIRSRENPKLKRWAKLASDASFRRSQKRVVVEGPHLVAEALQAGLTPVALMVSEAALRRDEIRTLVGKREAVLLDERLFRQIADAESPAGIAAEIELPKVKADKGRAAVFLEGVQDPSNVGAILRSAAAFGVGEMVLDRACADPWAPKVLRAGMGAHFRVALRQVRELSQALEEFPGTTVCTVPAGGSSLKSAGLEGPLGWIFGAEGRGVSEPIARHAQLKVTIPMAPGTESINVAAAAAICLYQTYRQ
jgi:RNA methyltransferase, TrmH family